MTTDKNLARRVIKPLMGSIAALLLGSSVSQAAPPPATNSTWNAHPADGDWGNASNWTPSTVPNTPYSAAIFNASSITTITLPVNTFTPVDSIRFNPGASNYVIRTGGFFSGMVFLGDGVINNSGKTQNFILGGTSTFAEMVFAGNSKAGKDTVYTVLVPRNCGATS